MNMHVQKPNHLSADLEYDLSELNNMNLVQCITTICLNIQALSAQQSNPHTWDPDNYYK